MKKYVALSLLSAAFLTSVGCTKPEAPKTGTSPAAVTSGAPMASPSMAPASGAPGAPVSGAPQAGMQTLPPYAGLSLDVPADWKHEAGPNHSRVEKSDKKVSIMAGKGTAEDVSKFKTAPDKEMAGSGMTDIVVDKATEKTDLINGINAWFVAGTGKMKGEAVEWGVWIYEGPNKESLIAVAIGDMKGNVDVLEMVKKSVKPNATPADVKAPEGKPEEKMGSPEAKAEEGKPEAKEDTKEEGGDKGGDAKEEGGDKGGEPKEDAKEEGGK